MKLKYYLRGLGIGIIVTVIIMMISFSGRQESITDAEVIQRAEKLGMVMQESRVSKLQNEDTSKNNEEDTGIAEVKKEAEKEAEKEDTASKKKVENDIQKEDILETSKEPEYVEIVVEEGEYSDKISEKLFHEKLIDNKENFNKFLIENGVDSLIEPGVHLIPKEATYEDIIGIMCEKAMENR